MPTIETIVRQLNRDLVPRFEEKLRAILQKQDREWLIDQIVRLTLDAHSLEEMDRRIVQQRKARARAERVRRLRALGLDHKKLVSFIEIYTGYDRDRLIREFYLLKTAPEKGTDLISDKHRTERGTELLIHAKDMLFGLLFGDESTNTRFDRREQEMLTLTVPRHKVDALSFMKATTELSAMGTWQDPESVSSDVRADNIMLEVEYGEIEGELIGAGIVRALSLINNLEVNEQILYARMVNIEQSTLID